MKGRDLLAASLVAVLAGFAWRGRGPPPLGPPHQAPGCVRPVEIPGEGVACDGTADERGARMAPARLAAFGVAVDLNRASAAELESLDGIGPRLAQRIVAARPFAGVDDLVRVRGIGEKRLAALRPRLLVTRATGRSLDE
jgi:competence ComEA-like helix-hairpin-helix protein